MNYTLLKELAKKAETECGFDSNKFAELIVRECASVVYNINLEAQPNDDGCYDQASFASDNDVLNHFGVSCFNGTN